MNLFTGTAPAGLGARLRANFQMDPKKTRILVILLPMLLAAWLPILAKKDAPVRRPVSVDAAASVALAVPATEPSGSDDVAESLSAPPVAQLSEWLAEVRRPREPQALARGPHLDPFSPPTGTVPGFLLTRADEVAAEQDRSPELEHELAQELRPTSIALSQSRGGLAVIHDRIFAAGDRVAGFVIVDIREREIVLRGEFAQYVVGIPITSTEASQ